MTHEKHKYYPSESRMSTYHNYLTGVAHLGKDSCATMLNDIARAVVVGLNRFVIMVGFACDGDNFEKTHNS